MKSCWPSSKKSGMWNVLVWGIPISYPQLRWWDTEQSWPWKPATLLMVGLTCFWAEGKSSLLDCTARESSRPGRKRTRKHTALVDRVVIPLVEAKRSGTRNITGTFLKWRNHRWTTEFLHTTLAKVACTCRGNPWGPKLPYITAWFSLCKHKEMTLESSYSVNIHGWQRDCSFMQERPKKV